MDSNPDTFPRSCPTTHRLDLRNRPILSRRVRPSPPFSRTRRSNIPATPTLLSPMVRSGNPTHTLHSRIAMPSNSLQPSRIPTVRRTAGNLT